VTKEQASAITGEAEAKASELAQQAEAKASEIRGENKGNSGQSAVAIDWEALKQKASELLSSLHLISNQTASSAAHKAEERNLDPTLTSDNARMKHVETASHAPHKSASTATPVAPAIPPDYESQTGKATAVQLAAQANVRD
jgi:hypothetical protein